MIRSQPARTALARRTSRIAAALALSSSLVACPLADERLAVPGLTCAAGDCSCEPGLASCDGDLANGCEVDLRTDPNHCGGCERMCANGRCVAGVCSCDQGFADCDPSPANGCETDLQRDSGHCGSCERDCLGGDCASGRCQPIALTDALVAPSDLVITPTHAFWISYGHGVQSLALDDGSGPQAVVGGESAYAALAFDGARLYWATDPDGIWSVVPGHPETLVEETTMAVETSSSPAEHGHLAPAGAYLFWRGRYVDPQQRGIWRMAQTGSGQPERIAAEAYDGPVAGAAHIYWGGSLQPSIWRVALGSNAPELFAPGSVLSGVAFAGTLYWTESVAETDGGTDLAIRSKLESGGDVTTLAELPYWSLCLTADESGLYLADTIGGAILRMPLAGGEAELLVSGQSNLPCVASDERWIYWLASNRLMRLAK